MEAMTNDDHAMLVLLLVDSLLWPGDVSDAYPPAVAWDDCWLRADMMAMMFFFWLLVIIGFIIGLRWLLGRGRGEKDDTALKILRERYARGDITKEEFEAKKKDLGPS